VSDSAAAKIKLLPYSRAFRNFVYDCPVSTEFLDRLASQFKVGKDPVSRRAIERILDVVKRGYEEGKYENPVEAERDFRQLVGLREDDK
jgi:hypothetical protein